MMGSAYGFTPPVKTFAETLYVEAVMEEGEVLTTPNSEEMAVYVVSGEVLIRRQPLKVFEMAILEDNTKVTIIKNQKSRIAIIGGEKMSKRFIEWNFVSSRKKRIQLAKSEWRENRFPKIPDDEIEYIPLP